MPSWLLRKPLTWVSQWLSGLSLLRLLKRVLQCLQPNAFVAITDTQTSSLYALDTLLQSPYFRLLYLFFRQNAHKSANDLINMVLYVTSLSLSLAFDVIDHNLFLIKLNLHGLGLFSNTPNLISSLLSNHPKQVSLTDKQ